MFPIVLPFIRLDKSLLFAYTRGVYPAFFTAAQKAFTFAVASALVNFALYILPIGFLPSVGYS